MTSEDINRPSKTAWVKYDLTYHRSGGWRILCECNRFEFRSDGFDMDIFYRFADHLETAHPDNSNDPEDFRITLRDMKGFVDFFNHQVDRSTGAKWWIVAIGVALGIGIVPLLTRLVDEFWPR